MNGINILLLVSFIANIFVLIALFTMLIIKERNNDKALEASHSVLYAKLMTITDKLNALLKNLDIEEEDKTEKQMVERAAYITDKATDTVQSSNQTGPIFIINPNKIDCLRGHTLDVIFINKECIKDIDLKNFYDIVIPMRATHKTRVEFY